jgi:hypothetical protein
VLGQRDQQQIEEVALVGGRLLARQQQMELLREGQPAHQVARQVAAAHLDAVGVGLRDVADRLGGLSDHRREPTSPATLVRMPAHRPCPSRSGDLRRHASHRMKKSFLDALFA